MTDEEKEILEGLVRKRARLDAEMANHIACCSAAFRSLADSFSSEHPSHGEAFEDYVTEFLVHTGLSVECYFECANRVRELDDEVQEKITALGLDPVNRLVSHANNLFASRDDDEGGSGPLLN